jgi:hypothetical protein
MHNMPRLPHCQQPSDSSFLCLNCRSRMTLAAQAGHTDMGRQLFIPRKPLFTPGQPRFIHDNSMFICGLPSPLAAPHH